MCWTAVSRQCRLHGRTGTSGASPLTANCFSIYGSVSYAGILKKRFQNPPTSSRLSASSALKFAGAAADMTALRFHSRFVFSIYCSEEAVPWLYCALLRAVKIKAKLWDRGSKFLGKVATPMTVPCRRLLPVAQAPKHSNWTTYERVNCKPWEFCSITGKREITIAKLRLDVSVTYFENV